MNTRPGATHPPRPEPRRTRRAVSTTRRIRVVAVAGALVFCVVAARAVQVQAIEADTVAAKAVTSMTSKRSIPAERGTITDRNGEVLAFSEATVNVIADPKMIMTNGKFDQKMTPEDKKAAAAAPKRIADLLARYLGGDAGGYLPALTKAGSQYSIVARQVSQGTYAQLSAAVKKAGLIGLTTENAPTRRYPGGTLASNVVGYVTSAPVTGGTVMKGGSGLESALNSTLSGTDGNQAYENSPNGPIPLGSSTLTPAVDGQSYQLTLDSGMQVQAEQILADRVNTTRADWGVALVMNVHTGELLALANYPTFDPNDLGKSAAANRGNRAISDPYTPGSVEKTLTFAAMLDTGTVRPLDVLTVPPTIRSGGNTIRDAWGHPTQKMYAQGIIAKSSNVGTIELARKMSKKTLYEYLTSFGLGSKTGIGLPGESAGRLPPATMPDYSRDSIAFGGSGLTVTAVQEAAAIAAVTNGGVYHQPTILKSTTLPDGTVQPVEPATPPRRVVSPETSAQVASLMEAMKVNATTTVFNVPGYRVGTKTGTAKRWNSGCQCWKGYTTSVIGIAPVEDPQILVYVVIDNPRSGSSGQGVAGPAWHDIMSIAAPRYGLPPSTTKPPALPIAP